MKMADRSPNSSKTLQEKEKLLVMINFSFSHSVFKRLVLQTRKNQGLFGKGLTLYNTITPFNDYRKMKPLENILGKGKKFWYPKFPPFCAVFFTLPNTELNFSVPFILLSACFNFGQYKNLLFGKELNCHFQMLLTLCHTILTLTHYQTTNFRLFKTENAIKLSKWVENTVGKGEIACYEQFLLFLVFSKGLFPRGVKRCH